jgi:hypothetical protein
VDADEGIWDGDACLGSGRKDGECSGANTAVSAGDLEWRGETNSELIKRSTFCSTISSEEPFNATLSGAVGADDASAGKMGRLPRCELGIQAFAPVAW